MGESCHAYTLDEALADVGFGKFQRFLFAYGGLGWVAESMEMMILSFIGTAVQSEWNLSSAQKSFISTVVFVGMLAGAYLWGVVSDSYGRKKAILGVAMITALGGLLSAFSPNYISLIVLRCIAGVGLGGMYIFNSWFLEFVPTRDRGAWMIAFSSFWTIGTIFEATLAWIVMPNFGWRWLVALSSGPSFIVLFLYGLAPESPRFLYVKGRTDEAWNILEKAALINGTTLRSGKPVAHERNGDNREIAASENTPLLPILDEKYGSKTCSPSLSVLFSSKLIRTTVLLWFLLFGNTFSYYGVILLTSELSSDRHECIGITLQSSRNENSSLYIDVFITSLAEVPGLILSAFIIERAGRKLCMVIMLALTSLLLLPLLIPQNKVLTTVLLFGARTFVSATITVAYIYAPEVYPTSIRTRGVGIATSFGKLGGMVCPIVAVWLVNGCHQWSALILFEVVIILSALTVWLSPLETSGRNLADTQAME